MKTARLIYGCLFGAAIAAGFQPRNQPGRPELLRAGAWWVVKAEARTLLRILAARRDEAFLAGPCVVVRRNVRPTEVFPEVDRVEVYQLNGRRRDYSEKDLGIRRLGPGQVLTSPDGRWAVILDQEEGVISGFFLITADCRVTQTDFLPRNTSISVLESPEPRFVTRDSLVVEATFTISDVTSVRKRILIRPDGSYAIDTVTAAEGDSAAEADSIPPNCVEQPAGRPPVADGRVDTTIHRDLRGGAVFHCRVHPTLPTFRFDIVADSVDNFITAVRVHPGIDAPADQELEGGGAEAPYRDSRYFEVVDLDADGFGEVMLMSWWGATGNVGYDVWRFDPAIRRFVADTGLSGLANIGGPVRGRPCVWQFQTHEYGRSEYCRKNGHWTIQDTLPRQ